MPTDIQTITREEIEEKLQRRDEFTIVDVLAPEGYAQAHLPTAINIPADRVSKLAPTELPDRTADIVVYCASPT